MTVTAYSTLTGKDSMELDRAVTNYIKEGWTPFANPYAIVTNNGSGYGTSTVYHQAMVKIASYKKEVT